MRICYGRLNDLDQRLLADSRASLDGQRGGCPLHGYLKASERLITKGGYALHLFQI